MTPAGRTTTGALPRWRRALAWLEVRRAGLGYAAFALATFVAALLYTLPHELIARRALEAATAGGPLAIDFRSVDLAFPNGYRFSGLRVTPQQKPDATIAIDELTVRAPLLALLLGDARTLDVSGRAFGGTIEGSAALRGISGGTLELALRDVELARALAPFVPPPGSVAGRATVELRLSGDGRTTQSAAGDLRATVAGLTLRQLAARGFPIPDLAFARAELAAQIAGPRVTVKQLSATGDDASLSATGDVALREPVAQSLLNLRFSVDVAAQAPPPLRLVTSLLPRRPEGEKATYTLGGTIAAPAVR